MAYLCVRCLEGTRSAGCAFDVHLSLSPWDIRLRDGGPELVAAGSGLRTEFVTCCDRPRAVVAEVEGTGTGPSPRSLRLYPIRRARGAGDSRYDTIADRYRINETRRSLGFSFTFSFFQNMYGQIRIPLTGDRRPESRPGPGACPGLTGLGNGNFVRNLYKLRYLELLSKTSPFSLRTCGA